ncbi:MAG: 3'-5' exonuclease, partial [Candidatus Cloacimonadota bacterium]|nr:3'-5' exonuclease [Candidatus Cloacimonadota bacterium]
SEVDTIKEEVDSLKLMTMHNAKGLEFDTVFVVGLEELLLPHERSIEDDSKLEEERRLLYVAITRAKSNLFLTHCKMRRIFNQNIRQFPSRFIKEMDKYLQIDDTSIFFSVPSQTYVKKKKNVILESKKYYQIGGKVEHKTFGKGTILNVDKKGKDAKLTISFNNGKLKKIISSFIKKI